MLNEILLWLAFICGFSGLPMPDLMPGFVVTTTKEAQGQTAREGDIVTVHFVAATLEGKELASTEKRGMPYRFRLGDGEVPPFLELTTYGMAVGGERKATVPPELAYGAAGMPPIVPPKTTLVVQLKLVKIERVKDGKV